MNIDDLIKLLVPTGFLGILANLIFSFLTFKSQKNLERLKLSLPKLEEKIEIFKRLQKTIDDSMSFLFNLVKYSQNLDITNEVGNQKYSKELGDRILKYLEDKKLYENNRLYFSKKNRKKIDKKIKKVKYKNQKKYMEDFYSPLSSLLVKNDELVKKNEELIGPIVRFYNTFSDCIKFELSDTQDILLNN